MSDGPRHCTDPEIHGPHTYGGDEAMLHCPGSGLRDRIADALHQWTLAAAGGRRLIPRDETTLRENSLARADAVMGVVGPEIAERDAKLKSLAHFNGMYFQDRADLEAQNNDLEDTLARVRAEHPPREVAPIYPIDVGAGRPGYTECATCRQPYPCPTIQAIDGSTDE